jgi:DHA1 family multidrug resistance protein-like MFS transporter
MEKDTANAFRILLLCVFMAMMGLGIVSPILPNYASDLGATGVMIGLIYSAFSISRAVLQTPVGRFADSYSKKRIIIIGLAAYTVTSVLYTFVSSPESLIAVRFVHGVGSAMVMPVAMAYAILLTPKGQEGKYMGYMNTALFSGFAAGPLLGGYIYENFSINTVFNAMSVLVFSSLVLTALFVPEEGSLGLRRERPSVSFRKILTNRRLAGIFVYRAVNALGRGTIMGFLPLFAVQTLGISGSVIGLILSMGIFANAVLQTPMGIIADRYNRNLLLIVGGLISSVGYFFMIGSRSSVDLFAIRLVVSAGGALSLPAITAMIAEEGKELGVGSTVGVFNTAMSLGQIVGPVFTGFLLDSYGMGAVFNFAGVIGVVSVGAFYLISHAGARPPG